MIQGAIAATLLAALLSPVPAAAQLAYSQASGLNAGKSAAETYDAAAAPARAQTAVQTQVNGALATGDLSVQAQTVTPPSALHPDLDASVPEPAQAAKGQFFSGRSLLFGGAGAAAGAVGGWFIGGAIGAVGGPLGAVIGALAGFAIGFLLSKLLS